MSRIESDIKNACSINSTKRHKRTGQWIVAISSILHDRQSTSLHLSEVCSHLLLGCFWVTKTGTYLQRFHLDHQA